MPLPAHPGPGIILEVPALPVSVTEMGSLIGNVLLNNFIIFHCWMYHNSSTSSILLDIYVASNCMLIESTFFT